MKLSLIHEADMSRRGFLKLLGKGAAAAYGAPLGQIAGMAASALPSPENWIRTYKNFIKANNIDKHKMTYFYTRMLDSQEKHPSIPVDVYKGHVANSILSLSKTGDVNNQLYNLENMVAYAEGPLEAALVPLFNYATDKMGGPQVVVNAILSLNPGGIDNNQTTMLDVFASEFKVVNDFLKSRGLDLNMWRNASYSNGEDLKMLEDAGLISKDVAIKTQSKRESAKAGNEKHTRELERRQRIGNDRSNGREVGYERESQFDPRSSRPAQALGPFESRLREVL